MALYESGQLKDKLDPYAPPGKGAIHSPGGLRHWSENRKLFGHSFAETLSVLMLIHTPVTKNIYIL